MKHIKKSKRSFSDIKEEKPEEHPDAIAKYEESDDFLRAVEIVMGEKIALKTIDIKQHRKDIIALIEKEAKEGVITFCVARVSEAGWENSDSISAYDEEDDNFHWVYAKGQYYPTYDFDGDDEIPDSDDDAHKIGLLVGSNWIFVQSADLEWF